MSYTPQVHKFFEAQANDRLFQNLRNAEKALNKFLDFINLGKIPEDYPIPEGLTNPIRDPAAFFSDAAEPIFYSLISQLSSTGIKERDVTLWKRRSTAPPSQQSEQMPNEQVSPGMEVPEQKKGFWSKVASAPRALASGATGFLSPPPVEEPERHVLEELYEAVPILYSNARTEVEIWGKDEARFHLSEIRRKVAIHLTGLPRGVRTYTNDLLMETGDQIARIAG